MCHMVSSIIIIITFPFLHVTFLQETRSDVNEIKWEMWWKGQYFLSHKTNVSAGVAILFSHFILINFIFSFYFNKKLLQDKNFCEYFEKFWQYWEKRSNLIFENLRQWWEIGKANIRLFWQQNIANFTKRPREILKIPENDISVLESELLGRHNVWVSICKREKKELGLF